MLIFDEINHKMYSRYKIIKDINYTFNHITMCPIADIIFKDDITLSTNNLSF